jgi:hypothetical protein
MKEKFNNINTATNHLNNNNNSHQNNKDLDLYLQKIDHLCTNRHANLLNEIRNRRVLLNNLHDSCNLYENRFRTELKWFHTLDRKIEEQKQCQENRYKTLKHVTIINNNSISSSNNNNDESEINELKSSLEPVAVRIFHFKLF